MISSSQDLPPLSLSLSLCLLAKGRGDLSRQTEEARLACQQTERGVV